MKINNPTLKVLMNEANNHGVYSAFIVTAVERYANEVLANKEQLKKDMKNSIVSPELWIAIAENAQNIVGGK